MSQEVPLQRQPTEDDRPLPSAEFLNASPLTEAELEAITLRDMVERGLLTEEDYAQAETYFSDQTIANLERRYRYFLVTLDNLRRQQDMLREQLGILSERNERLARDVQTDYLTGLGSRKALDERREELEGVLKGERRRAGEDDTVAVVVLSVDIINLKSANAISQQEGDRLIVRVASDMRALFRDRDVFRRGGDEFIGLFPVRNELEFSAIIDKIHQLASEEGRQRMRIGYYVAYASGKEGVLEVEALADPKTHPENRV